MIDKRLLKYLSKKYPNVKAATEEIVNLTAILSLPKGTEYYLSDLHGEHEAFIHMLKSASGVIRARIEEVFGPDLAREERDALAALIYNAEAEMKRRKKTEENFDKWCKVSIYRLVMIFKSVTNKYTRSKIRKRLPEEYAYILDELLHTSDEANKGNYYGQIISTIVDCRIAEDFIEAFTAVISSLTVDKLHIIGDIWDRGAHPDSIMDYLMEHPDVDFQWGNHDVVWMGAATGNRACITNVLRMNISYNNFDMLEIGYGINLRPLAVMAEKVYSDDPCEFFRPKRLDENEFDPIDDRLAAKMNKAISICQFKIEGQKIMQHPEYGLEKRLLLDKIDFDKGTVVLRDGEFPLRDTNFPTVDPEDPYRLTDEEEEVISALEASFLQSEKLQKHVRFMYSHGALYEVQNNILMYHGCIPIDDEGRFEVCSINGRKLSGRAYMDYLDSQLRYAYFNPDECDSPGHPGDLMWYLWLGSKSPLFGKDQMTTFERCFVTDKKTHKEHTVAYYRYRDSRKVCDMILEEFGLVPEDSIILNGHVPVKIKDGESPVKGEGQLIVIDGGMSKAYQKQTGIAGYTFIFNSRFMALSEHKPYSPLKADGTQEFFAPVIRTVRTFGKRMLIRDTDRGRELQQEVDELKELVSAYRSGKLTEDKN